MPRPTVVVVAAGALGLLLGGWGITRLQPPPSGTTLGERPPDYRLVELPGGDSVSLRDLSRGHVTLVNIWATWCPPCRSEMPSIERLYRQYHDRGLRVAAVSIDAGQAEAVMAFVRTNDLTFDILQDRSGQIQERWETLGVPQSFLLDRQGRVAYAVIGGTDWDSAAMHDRVDHLLPATD